jgi:hypothetical protein
MSLLQYTISNTSAASKTFSYYVETVYNTVVVAGNSSVTIIADDSPAPALIPVGTSEEAFLSASLTPTSGEVLLWSDGNKVKHIKISNTPLTGSSINSLIGQTEWVEFSMVGAKNKDGNFLYPNSTTTPQSEKFNIVGANNQTTYSLLEIKQSTSSPAVTADTSSVDTGFSTFDKQFLVPTNCSPLANNVVEQRTNEWLQDIDYTVNAITPINFEQLINFEAARASVPQSNYTQLGFRHSRYEGSSTTRDNINEYNPKGITDPINKISYDKTDISLIDDGKGPSLGKIPNVELNNAYIAYFDKIIDPYPLLNNKTAYRIKYLIDDSGNILNPGLSNINYSIFTETFKLKDYDGEPTRINTSIQNINESKELTKLTSGLSSVYEIGQYPVPILYSQTSNVGHANEIYLSGSKFFSSIGPNETFTNYGVNIFALQNDTPTTTARLTPVSLNLNSLEFTSADITPLADLDIVIPTGSLTENGNKTSIFFPVDNNAKEVGLGKPLSDNYEILGSFQFSTSAMPAQYLGRDTNTVDRYLVDYDDRKVDGSRRPFSVFLNQYLKTPASSDIASNYFLTNQNFSISDGDIYLTITSNPGGPNQSVSKKLKLAQNPAGYSPQWSTVPGGIIFSPDSLYIEDLIIKEIFGKNDVRNKANRREAVDLIGGGWFTELSQNYGVGGVPIKYDWEINFKITGLVQGSGVYLQVGGNVINQPEKKTFITDRPTDVFLFFGSNGGARENLQWRRTFTPTYATGVNTKPIIKYTVTSPNSAASNIQNSSTGPFWRKLSGKDNELYMSSSILNQTYGLPFIQAKLPYSGSFSTDFPLTVEPDFIEFDPVTDFWSLQEGDEIRFENNEDLVYTITKVTPPKNISSENEEDKLRVIITPPFNYTNSNGKIIKKEPSNFDFFVVRRWKENKNFIILNQQKPYGFPVTQSSSPGILLPEHRIDKFNVNPDLVLKDLIEKNII